MDQVSNALPEDAKNYETQTWSSFENLGNGIIVYRDVLTKDLEIIKRLEENLNENHPRYHWMEAFVGYQQSMPEYRDCQDFKFKKNRYLSRSKPRILKSSVFVARLL